MHIVFSEENEGTDFIIQNTVGLPIFVEKSDKEQTITVTNILLDLLILVQKILICIIHSIIMLKT